MEVVAPLHWYLKELNIFKNYPRKKINETSLLIILSFSEMSNCEQHVTLIKNNKDT
ncbi:MAG: hypothetical protein ACJAX7_001352 [Saprospiraceae bacterium]|jgi:hypothetical protein